MSAIAFLGSTTASRLAAGAPGRACPAAAARRAVVVVRVNSSSSSSGGSASVSPALGGVRRSRGSSVRASAAGLGLGLGDEHERPATLTGGGNGDDGLGGRGGGGGGDGSRGDGGSNEEEGSGNGLWGVAGLAALACAFPPGAAAAVAMANNPSGGDTLTCFMYGFVIFYGIKMGLKYLFAPYALFMVSMYLLTQTGALPKTLGPEVYEGFIKPYIPKEFLTKDYAALDKDYSAKFKVWEKKFWTYVHRVLPASNHPICEKAFFAGIFLAGLV